MITIEQCRGARGLLDWTQQDLADASGLSKTAINNFEKGHSDIKAESSRAIRMAFESADIEFLGEEGLRKKTEKTWTLKGSSAFGDLLDDIYITLKDDKGSEIFVTNMDENITTLTPPKKLLEHLERLKDRDIIQRVLCSEGTSTMMAAPDFCRWLPKDSVQTNITTFIYADKVALELWDQSMIVIVESREAAQAERRRFESMWAKAQTPLRREETSPGRTSSSHS